MGNIIERARELRKQIEAQASGLEDETALEYPELFPKWQPDMEVKAGERYQYDGVLYKVIQSHTTQADWTPDATPAIFVKVSIEEWPEFVQPTSAADAYNKGDKITWNGEHYVCILDGCVWSPTDYPTGWEKQD